MPPPSATSVTGLVWRLRRSAVAGRSSTIARCRKRASPPTMCSRAAGAIRGAVHRTPTFTSRSLGPGRYLKAELFQRTGSFKARGALNRVRALSPDGARGRRDQRLGRKPRPGAGVGGGDGAPRCAARDVAGRERREDRCHPRLRRRGRSGGAGTGRGVRPAARAPGADGADLRPPVRRPRRDRRRRHRRARDPRGRAGRRHDRRRLRRRRPRLGDRGRVRAGRVSGSSRSSRSARTRSPSDSPPASPSP